MVPQDELDRLATVKRQAEFISREGFPELGYSVLQQGYRRIDEWSEPWTAAAESMWQDAIRDHCELFSIAEFTSQA